MSLLVPDNGIVLFQGDSITDAGRSREDDINLGMGYPMLTAAWFSAMYPEKNVKFINRGISGDRAISLCARWKEDCIDLKPSVVSILIGINDTWRRYDSNDPTTAAEYEKNYREVLTRTVNEPDARIIIFEPFVLPTPADRIAWREDLDPKIDVARKLAREFNTIFVPLDGLFAQASAMREPAFWAADGVHPTPAGHALIAQSWFKAIGAR
jgi:lysophospholipase L1-like esterase